MKKNLIAISIILLIAATWLFFFLSNRPGPSQSGLNLPLAHKLGGIFRADQSLRRDFDSLRVAAGDSSGIFIDRVQQLRITDSLSLIEVKNILDSCGWLGEEVVGQDGTSALFLAIQHADPLTREKYLPMLRKAAKEGKVSPHQLAMLEDRVLIEQGRRQKYGSQVGYDQNNSTFYLLPLDNPETVDSLRLALGLEPLAEYLSHWNIPWGLKKFPAKTSNFDKNE